MLSKIQRILLLSVLNMTLSIAAPNGVRPPTSNPVGIVNTDTTTRNIPKPSHFENDSSNSNTDNIISALNSEEGTLLNSIPDFVKEYAPMMWFDTKELYYPSLLDKHMLNCNPRLEFDAITDVQWPATLSNLDQLNAKQQNGKAVYMTANQNLGEKGVKQPWLLGEKPVDKRSSAPAQVFVVDKGNGVVDAFWLFFYSFNLGPKVVGIEFGNHVGDWEHVNIRFEDRVPKSMWFSQHAGGQAFQFNNLKKHPGTSRPYVYVAKGTHANYAKSGTHGHELNEILRGVNLPFGFVEDKTSEGTLWDPLLTAPMYYISTDANGRSFAPASENADLPTNWLNFVGKWGDKTYKRGTKNQWDFFGKEYHFSDGPTGPIDKGMGRRNVYPDDYKGPIFPHPIPKMARKRL